MNFRHAVAGFLSLAALGCSSNSTPESSAPAWVTQPTRVVDNGYIVYTGSGEEINPNEATLVAEGAAIQDLANECSFVPKGTRVEDHYSQKLQNVNRAYARVAIEYQVCDQALKTLDPQAIKDMASAPFSEELKRYQDFMGNGAEFADSEGPPLAPPPQPQGGGQVVVTPAPVVVGGGVFIASDVHFFMMRQYVAYQKEVVVLAPPSAYAAGSPESQTYIRRVEPVMAPIQHYAEANPQFKTGNMTWSKMEPAVRNQFPQAFRRGYSRGRPLHPPAVAPRSQKNPNGNPQPRRRGRRHAHPTENP